VAAEKSPQTRRKLKPPGERERRKAKLEVAGIRQRHRQLDTELRVQFLFLVGGGDIAQRFVPVPAAPGSILGVPNWSFN